MIFLCVGNATQGFLRLLESVDKLAGEGVFAGKEVFIQSGNNPEFRPRHCSHKSFLTMEDFVAKIREADLIISHAGAGALLHILQAGKVAVVMPRRKKYGEHVDDHQAALANALTAEGRIIPAYEPEDLPQAIAEARRRNRQPVPPPPSHMLSLVAQAIEELLDQKK